MKGADIPEPPLCRVGYILVLFSGYMLSTKRTPPGWLNNSLILYWTVYLEDALPGRIHGRPVACRQLTKDKTALVFKEAHAA